MKWFCRTVFLALAALFAAPRLEALEVVFDNRTPRENREWADRSYIREQMEVVGAKICKALYEGQERENLHENFRITLYPAPVKGGNPGFATGRRITWKVGKNPRGNGSGGMGLLCHEMTHVLDMGSDRVFTEAMADWVRNYKVWYGRCSDPAYVLDLRYRALRGARRYGKYMAGANFIDFMTQTYGEGTIYRILQGYRKHGKNHWEKTFGKDFAGLLAEWRDMETIYDPVYQWTYNATAKGKSRWDKHFCALRGISCKEAQDKSGAWLAGTTAGKVTSLPGGGMAIALHGRFPQAGRVAIASLGSARRGNGKAILLATGPGSGTLAAHVVATVPGRGCAVVSTTRIRMAGPRGASHSVVMSVKGGDAAEVVVDGRLAAKVDMKWKCPGCTFAPEFAIGGMSGGLGVAGFAEPKGKDGVLLDDMRVFTRAFRSRETADYAAAFDPDYRPAVATLAQWQGPQGSSEINDKGKWFCVNSHGERIAVLPSKDTAVRVLGKALPSIPPGSKFVCRSFTIDGWAVADSSDIDLRGVKIVDLADNTRLITRGGHRMAVNALRAKRARLDGSLSVASGLKITGGLELSGGSSLGLPADHRRAFVQSISLKGEGPVAIMPGATPSSRRFLDFLQMGVVPADLSRFRLDLSDGPDGAVYRSTKYSRHSTLSVKKGARRVK